MSATFSATKMEIRDAAGALKLDTSVRHPVVLARRSGSLWFTQPWWDLYGHGGVATPTATDGGGSYTLKVGDYGSHYSVVPDFVIARCIIVDNFGTREITLAGSEVVAVGPGLSLSGGNVYREECFAIMAHLYLSGGDAYIKMESANSYLYYPHEGSPDMNVYKAWLRKLPIIDTAPGFGGGTEWRLREYRVDLSFELVFGKVMG